MWKQIYTYTCRLNTKYTVALPHKSNAIERVVEACIEMLTRVEMSKEVLSDIGTLFTSNEMKEVDRLLSHKQLTNTPYHPACNGLVEKYKCTFKILMSSETSKDCDRYVALLLFNYRNVPQDNTSFSPFKLLYDIECDPMSFLRDTQRAKEV